MHGSEQMACLFVQLIFYLCLHTHMYCLAESPEKESRMPSANSSGSHQILPDLASLCPYNRFCRSSPIKEISGTDEEPCCEECSCDYDCHETGRCCPDMPLAGIVKPKYPCVHLSDFGNVQNGQFWKNRKGFYHIITDCSDIVKAVSYPECYQPRVVQDFVIVSDPETGRVYRNKHCAECNDVQKYISWKLQVDCRELSPLMYIGGFAERDRYIMENCSLVSLPLAGRAADIYHCVPQSDIIKICNLTGKWDFYDSKIEEACMENREDQNTLFANDIEYDEDYEYYSSVYCYLCNVPKHSKKEDICKPSTDADRKSGGRVSLYAILDSKMWEDPGIKDSRCISTDIWDPYRKLCRPLICPSGKIPVHGNCKGTFSNLEGYAVAIHFEVIFLTGSMAANSDFLQVLENRFYWELGNDLPCGKCWSGLHSDRNSSSTLFLRLEVFSTNECPDDTLLKKIKQIAAKKKMYVKYKFAGQQFKVELRFFPKEIDIGNVYEVTAARTNNFCKIKKVIDSSIFRYCPRIKLTKDEARVIGIYNVSESVYTFSSQTNDTNREFQEVCVDTYFIASKARSGAMSVYPYGIVYFTNYTRFHLLIILISSYVSWILFV